MLGLPKHIDDDVLDKRAWETCHALQCPSQLMLQFMGYQVNRLLPKTIATSTQTCLRTGAFHDWCSIQTDQDENATTLMAFFLGNVVDLMC